MALLQQLGDGLVTARKVVEEIRKGFSAFVADSQRSIAQVRQDQQELPMVAASAQKALVEVTVLASTTQQSLLALQSEMQQLSTQLAASGQTRVEALSAAGKVVQGQLAELTVQVSRAMDDVQSRGGQLVDAAGQASQAFQSEGEQQASEYKAAGTILADADTIVQSTYQTAQFDQLASAARNLSNRLQVLAQETLPGEAGKLVNHLSGVYAPAVQASHGAANRTFGERHADFLRQGQEAAQQLTQAVSAQTELNQQAVGQQLPEQVHAAAASADQAAQQLSKEADISKRTAAHISTHLKDAQDRYFEAVLALHTELQRMVGGKR